MQRAVSRFQKQLEPVEKEHRKMTLNISCQHLEYTCVHVHGKTLHISLFLPWIIPLDNVESGQLF